MILALSTDGPVTRFALFEAGSSSAQSPVAEETWESGRALATELPGRVRDLLAAQSTSLEGLTGLVILSGPGSFTSLRIGHAWANAVASSLNLPLVGTTGDAWIQDGLEALGKVAPGRPTWPLYGAEANVTRPKG